MPFYGNRALKPPRISRPDRNTHDLANNWTKIAKCFSLSWQFSKVQSESKQRVKAVNVMWLHFQACHVRFSLKGHKKLIHWDYLSLELPKVHAPSFGQRATNLAIACVTFG